MEHLSFAYGGWNPLYCIECEGQKTRKNRGGKNDYSLISFEIIKQHKKLFQMSSHKTLYFPDREKWREWLENNFEREKEIWLVFPKKASGKSRLSYNDAVEEALCFGWIDSTVKSFNEESFIQRFSPRNPKSGYSQPNKERLRWLLNNSRLHPTVQKMAERMLQEKFEFPEDIISALKEDPEVWLNYQNFSSAYQRIRVAYIDSARNRPEEFEKRLQNFIEKTRQNTLIGFGGIEKYY